MKGIAMRRVLVAAALAALVAVWTGSATAAPPQRTVVFELTDSYTLPGCGDTIFVEHDVGRFTFTVFSAPRGAILAAVQGVARSTVTNTDTGESVALFGSHLVQDHALVDPRTGAITFTERIAGLNFLIAGTNGPPIVSAGLFEASFLLAFDAEGNTILTFLDARLTPNWEHLREVLCA